MTSTPESTGPPALRCGSLVIDRERHQVTVHERPVALTYMEFRLLWLVVEGQGRVLSYGLLAEQLWGAEGPAARRRLAVLMSRLRTKLGLAAGHIETVQRVGYRALVELPEQAIEGLAS